MKMIGKLNAIQLQIAFAPLNKSLECDMNERIRELAEESYNEFYTIHIDLEKFAELIVRECAGIVTDAVDHREPASTYVDKIKQHFGVE
jgi:hypothetical protein